MSNGRKRIIQSASFEYNVGDRVKILRPEYTKDGHEWGTITNINGAYITIRPYRCKWEMEAYPNEIGPMGFGDGAYRENQK